MALVLDPEGYVIVAGSFYDSIDLGGGVLLSAGEQDGYIAKLTSNGEHVWSKRFGGPGIDYAEGLSVDSDGNVFVVGSFASNAEFGGATLISAGDVDTFVARYNGSGALHAAYRFGGAFDDYCTSVRVTPDQDVLLLFTFGGDVDFGLGTVENFGEAGSHDVYVLRLTRNLDAPSLGLHLGGPGGDWASQLAVSDDGYFYVGAGFDGGADYGGGPMTSNGGLDGIVARYDTRGAYGWAVTFGAGEHDGPATLEARPDGGVVFGATFQGTIMLDGELLESAGLQDALVASYAPDGSATWVRRLGGAENDVSPRVAVTTDGGVLLAATLRGTTHYGTGPIESLGLGDIVLAHYTAQGAALGTRHFTGDKDETARAVLHRSSRGDALISGTFGGAAAFGALEVESNGLSDVFVAALTY